MTRQELTHANTHDAHANTANKLTHKLTQVTVTGISAGQKLTQKLTRFTVTESTNSRQILTQKLTRFTFSTKPQVKNSRKTHATYSRTPLSKEREGGPTLRKHPTHPRSQPMPPSTRPQDLPEIRAALLDWYQHHGSKYFTACLESGTQRLHFPTTDAEAAGRWYSHTEGHRLASAELFWVSREMTELCVAAARSMPEWNLFPDDMPSPTGFIYFDGLPDLRDFPATAFSWGPCAQKIIDGMGLKGPSVWVSHYTDISELQISTTHLPLPQLIYGSESISAFGHREPGDVGYTATGLEDFVETTDHDLTTKASSLVILKTAWLLMQQGVGDTNELTPDRAARKRLARAGHEPKPVRVIGLRRPKREPNGPGDSDREYHHQWIVRGHWRNHWHPKRQVHRPVWIAPHIKGPDGAPLIGGEKVYALKR